MARQKASAQPETFSAHYISGTHWDREWYRPLQEYRLLLVEIIDGLLDLMEKNQDFKYFHLDGQTCVLRDYVEVRPENEGRLKALMQQGRILVGPWFTMPDLFCPGDEALIRNFLLARRISREWGVEPMPVAYTCDMFGHPSQMPQIYRGFDLRHCVLGRGTNEHTTPAFFTWAAPDGSSVFCFKLQDSMGYGAFVGSRHVIEHAPPDADTKEVEAKARESFAKYVAHETSRTNGSVLCLIDALDHMPPATDAPRYLRILHEACPNVRAKHSILPAFFEEAEKAATDLPTRVGELREPSKTRNGYLWLIPNCVSSRVRMKQANDACQTLLERWVEPLLALANLGGAAIPTRFLRIAWEHVLTNHAHDSICGCSIDQVHRDMMHRFDQARTLGDQLRNKAFGTLTAAFADLATKDHEFSVVIANPVPLRRREVIHFDIDLPLDYPTFFHEGFRGAQDIKSFTLQDPTGKEIPYQRLAVNPRTIERTRFALPATCGQGEFARYTVAAEVELPGLGFTALVVRPCPTPYRRIGSLRTGPTSAENDHLALAIAPNATLTLTDKATGETYTDLLTFEDRGELGDGWFSAHSETDEIALSSACPTQVSVVHDGPEVVTFRVAVTMSVPARFDRGTERRSTDRVELPIVSLISLRRGARTVEVETTVENTAEDHRLRLLLPTDAEAAETYLAHHPFDLVERRIALDPETVTWQEMELAEKPFLGLQSVGAGTRGLAFLSAGGLHEGGVADDARRTMLVTLVRSYRRTVGTPGEPDGLEKGMLRYRYALMPFAGELPRAEALGELARLQGGLMTRQTGRNSSGYPAMSGKTSLPSSYVEQKTGRLILSTVKAPESGGDLILRLWNPTGQKQTETVALWRRIKRATLVKLCEDPGGAELAVKGDTVALEAGPHQIVTVRVELG
jgi:alpha-mannosidase/mannosylglycerate hydrolase